MGGEFLHTLAAVVPVISLAAALIVWFVRAELKVLTERISALKELVETQLEALPCKNGHICHSDERSREIADVRQAMDTIGAQVSHLIQIAGG